MTTQSILIKVRDMTSINKLSSVDTLDDSDLIPLYSAINGDARKISGGKLKALMGNGAGAVSYALGAGIIVNDGEGNILYPHIQRYGAVRQGGTDNWVITIEDDAYPDSPPPSMVIVSENWTGLSSDSVIRLSTGGSWPIKRGDGQDIQDGDLVNKQPYLCLLSYADADNPYIAVQGTGHTINRNTVSDMISDLSLLAGNQVCTGNTIWSINNTQGLSLSNGLFAKASGDVFYNDFKHASLTDTQTLVLANDYCQNDLNRNRLVFEGGTVLSIEGNTSFIIYVEGGGWYCSGNTRITWSGSPTAGYATNIRGRHTVGDSYNTRLNDSNYKPMEGITIGESGQKRLGAGLKLGHADGRQTSSGAVVTSKFMVSRVNIFEFDDVLDFYTGVWACEFHQVNTIGGSLRTPSFFNGIDFGENIAFYHCFIGDNHTRLVDGVPGSYVFSAGEWCFYGGSFDNMRVTVAGDSMVKMYGTHFENPASTAKNKRFLEVTGAHAYCLLNSPVIVTRATDVYSNLFWCEAATDASPWPKSGGLVITSPTFSSNAQYRPDLGSRQGVIDGVTYESDDTLAMVGGGGRVYLTGGVHVNSLFYSYNPIPIAANLVGASIANYDFEIDEDGDLPSFWTVNTVAPYTATTLVSDGEAWKGYKSLKTTVSYNGGATFISSQVYQEIDCHAGQLVLGSCKCKWITELTGGATGAITGGITVALEFYDRNNNLILAGWSNNRTVTGDSSTSYDDWEHFKFTDSAPMGTAKVRVRAEAYSSSDDNNKKIHVYYDAFVINVL